MAASDDEKDQQKEKVAEPVSDYIRFLISRWERDGKKLNALAKAAGLAKSMPSQIKAGTSDSSFYSATKLAKPLGHIDLPDLVTAAYAWARSADRSVIPGRSAESPVAEAVRLARGYKLTQAQIDRVLLRLPPEMYPDEDALFWLARFHEERSLDELRDAHAKARAHTPAAVPERIRKRRVVSSGSSLSDHPRTTRPARSSVSRSTGSGS